MKRAKQPHIPKQKLYQRLYHRYINARWRQRLPRVWRIIVDVAALVVVGYLAVQLAILALEVLLMLLIPVVLFSALAGGAGSRSDHDRWMEENDPRGYERTHAADQVHFD